MFFNGECDAGQAFGRFRINTAAFRIKEIHVPEKVVGCSVRQGIPRPVIPDKIDINGPLLHNLKEKLRLKGRTYQLSFVVSDQIEINVQRPKHIPIFASGNAVRYFFFVKYSSSSSIEILT